MTNGGPSVDVVVVAYNSRDTLRGCVEPLTGIPWVRVIVVDNASPDDCAAVIADLPAQVIRAPRNGGFAYGCNLGIAEGDSEFVLLLNPDARIDADGLGTLVDALRADRGLGAVGPRTIDDDGRLVWSQRRFPRLRSTYAQALFLQRVAPRAGWADEVIRDRDAYERPCTPDWLSGACLVLRREAVDGVGGLDESFFLYSEETDLFRRMRAQGWGLRYVPDATAQHQGGASAPRETTKRIWAQSRVRYARKHHGRAVALLEAAGVALGALTHAVVWLHRPARARGHASAAHAALIAARSSYRTG
jgi:N-acetylglucosaminyl-diphospho-decaprenol L-rhamnosyltransferase